MHVRIPGLRVERGLWVTTTDALIGLYDIDLRGVSGIGQLIASLIACVPSGCSQLPVATSLHVPFSVFSHHKYMTDETTVVITLLLLLLLMRMQPPTSFLIFIT